MQSAQNWHRKCAAYSLNGTENFVARHFEGSVPFRRQITPTAVACLARHQVAARHFAKYGYHGDIDGIVGPLTESAMIKYAETHEIS